MRPLLASHGGNDIAGWYRLAGRHWKHHQREVPVLMHENRCPSRVGGVCGCHQSEFQDWEIAEMFKKLNERELEYLRRQEALRLVTGCSMCGGGR